MANQPVLSRSKMKLAAMLGLLMGGWFLYLGGTELSESLKLKSRSVTATASVTEGESERRRKGFRHYYLTVQFQTKGGQAVTEKVEVDEKTYDAATASGTTTVYYLEENPSVLQAGVVKLRFWMMVAGMAFLGVAGLLVVGTRRPTNLEEAPPYIIAKLKESPYVPAKYAVAEAASYARVDTDFYDQSQKALEEFGFKMMGTWENLNLKKQGVSLPLRYLISPGGTTYACIVHVNPLPVMQKLGHKELKMVELESGLLDGRLILTTNNEPFKDELHPASMDVQCLPADAPVANLVSIHQARLEPHLEGEQGTRLRQFHSKEEFERFLTDVNILSQGFSKKKELAKSVLIGIQPEVTNADIASLIQEVDRQMAAQGETGVKV